MSSKIVSSILVAGTIRLTTVKVVCSSCDDSSRIPRDAIWRVVDVGGTDRQRRAIHVRITGGLSTLTDLIKFLKRVFCIDSDVASYESCYSKLSNETLRVAGEQLPIHFPTLFPVVNRRNHLWPGLLGVFFSFHAGLRSRFVSSSLGLLEDEMCRWLVAGDDKPLSDALVEKSVLIEDDDDVEATILRLCSVADVSVLPLNLSDDEDGAVTGRFPRLYDKNGGRMLPPDRPGGSSEDGGGSIALVKKEKNANRRPDVSFEYNGINYSLAASFPKLPRGGEDASTLVVVGNGQVVEIGRCLVASSIGPVLHSFPSTSSVLSNDVLPSFLGMSGGRSHSDFVWVYTTTKT